MKSHGSRAPLLCLGLCLLTLTVYREVVDGGFILYDDPVYVTGNYYVGQGLTRESLAWAFTTTRASNWHPLTWISHMADVEWYGLHPWGHHLTGLLFHLANTVLLFLILLAMSGVLWASAFTAALFAVHPLHVESVAWIAERKDLLSTFFWALSLGAYLRYVRRPAPVGYFLLLLTFSAGLLAKPMIVTLPFLLLLLDYWPLGRVPGGGFRDRAGTLLLEKIPLLALSAASSAATYFAQYSGGALSSLEVDTLSARIRVALWAYAEYLVKTIWPRDLVAFYPDPGNSLPLGVAAACGLALTVGTVLVVRAARRHPYCCTGWFWYLGTLVPAIGLVKVGNQAMADRYTYVPSIGLFIMAAWWIPAKVAGWRLRKAVLGISGLTVIAILATATRIQVGYWKDTRTLFSHALESNSSNWLAYTMIGNVLLEEGNAAAAATCYRKAVQLMPNLSEAYANLGKISASEGNPADALKYYATALRIRPNDPVVRYNVGNAFYQLGRLEEAAAGFQEAIRLDPRFAAAHYNLGAVYAAQGRSADAVRQYRETVRIKPDLADAYNNLGSELYKLGRRDESMSALTEAVRLRPAFADAHYNLGLILEAAGRWEEARRHYQETLRADNAHASAKKRLAMLLRQAD